MNIHVRLHLFAGLRDRLGATLEYHVVVGTSVGGVWRKVVGERPEIRSIPVRFAIDEEYVKPSLRLDDDVEVAVFPPVSGGC